MADKLSAAAAISLVCVFIGLALHIVGFVTGYWFVNSETSGASVRIGLWEMEIKSSNGSNAVSDSAFLRQGTYYVIMAVSGANALICLVVFCKRIPICVGVIAFITSTLMCVAVYFSFTESEAEMHSLEERHPEWSKLKLSWSFILLFTGIIVNVTSSWIFLCIILIQGEKIASSKGLGVDNTKPIDNDTEPIVSVISSNTNDAYEHEHVYENTAADITPYYAYPGPSNPEIICSIRL